MMTSLELWSPYGQFGRCGGMRCMKIHCKVHYQRIISFRGLLLILTLPSLSNDQQESQQKAPRWIPPLGNVMKINVDATISKNTGRSAAAAIARVGTGSFIGASVLIIDGITEPESMEVVACRLQRGTYPT